jgi:hypothetical protein
MAQQHPRFGPVGEVATAVLFCCQSKAKAVTGQCVDTVAADTVVTKTANVQDVVRWEHLLAAAVIADLINCVVLVVHVHRD